MKVMGLDLSTSTGIAVFKGEELIDTALIKSKVKGNYRSESYPYNYIDMSEDIALKVIAAIFNAKPQVVVIEETNKGKERYRQKMLEFIHASVIKMIRNLDNPPEIRYIDTSSWRKILQIGLSKEDRVSNKHRNKERSSKRDEISKELYERYSLQIASEVKGLGKRDSNKIFKKWEKDIKVMVGKEMRKFRSSTKIVDNKNLSVNYVNEKFNLSFKKSDNDRADAICVGYAFIKNNYKS